MARLQELLEQSRHIEERERQWQNEVMLQETESQASNTTEQDIEESGEEKTNDSNRDHKRPPWRPKSNGTINANKEWSVKEIFLLINAWREIDQLYNVKHPKKKQFFHQLRECIKQGLTINRQISSHLVSKISRQSTKRTLISNFVSGFDV